MLLNFLVDSDLQAYYPDMVSFRRGGQVDYSDMIAKAHEVVIRDIINKGVNPRLLMVPIDLNRDATTDPNHQHLESWTLSASDVGYAWKGKGREGRFVITISDRTTGTGWDFLLQGSNESDRPADASTYWTTIKTVVIVAANGEGLTNYTFNDTYKWYRLKVTKTDAVVGSVAFTAGVYETVFDNLIIYRALQMIASVWRTEPNDQWDMRYTEVKALYEDALNSIHFWIDSDEDGIADSTEGQSKVGGSFGSMPSIA